MLLPELSDEQVATLEKSIKEFRGISTTLESALGALIIGNKLGWRVLKMCHSSATLKKYEKILGIKYEDICPERTELSRKNFGIVAADKLKAFWAVATGKRSIKNRADLSSPEEVEKQVDSEINKDTTDEQS